MFRTGLTIPLQITLSDIKLSGFIILVFSRQKGLTLVFRNDPLESLKVSSTFDSIPFVRDYLQKEIEGQLRILLMDELPAIIHRLSLRLWVPEYRAREERESAEAGATSQDEAIVDPFASPPQDPVDSHGHKLNPSEIASLSIETGIETQSLFSQKNLLRLATLTDSHRTLSLFTPSIRDVVFRAWAGPTERGEVGGGLRSPIFTPALSRSHSYSGSTSTTYTFDGISQGRPALQSYGSHSYGLSMGAGRHAKGHGARQRKKRVVNMRKKPDSLGHDSISEDGSTFADSASVTESTDSSPSIFSAPLPSSSQQLRDEDCEPVTPPRSPYATIRQGKRAAAWAADQHSTIPQAERTQPPRGSLAHAFETPTRDNDSGRAQHPSSSSHGQNRNPPAHTDLDATPEPQRSSQTVPDPAPATITHNSTLPTQQTKTKISRPDPPHLPNLPLPHYPTSCNSSPILPTAAPSSSRPG